MAKGFQKGYTPWNKGIPRTEEWKKEHSEQMKTMDVSLWGKAGAEKRWAGHIKTETKKTYKRKYIPYSARYTTAALLERKRFRNMRYKARKRNAPGSHLFIEWMLLKQKYNNMCLCCKQFEPQIKLTEDHIIPLILGGSDSIDNIQPLCVSCNTRKYTKTTSYLPINDAIFGSLKSQVERTVN